MVSARSKRTYTSSRDGCASLPARFYDMNTTFRSAAMTHTKLMTKPTCRRGAPGRPTGLFTSYLHFTEARRGSMASA